MRNLVFLFITVSMLFLSCNEKKGIANIEKTPATDQIVATRFDTIYSKDKLYVLFEKLNENYGVFHWGLNGQYKNVGKDTVNFDSSKTEKINVSKEYLTYEDGCGTACNFTLLMKFESGNNGELLMYPILTKLDKGVIAYKGDEENVLLYIRNLSTNKITEIKEEYDTTLRPPSSAIDSVFINSDDKIEVSWYDQKSKIRSKAFEW